MKTMKQMQAVTHPSGKRIQINFTPDWQVCIITPSGKSWITDLILQSAYMPSAAVTIGTIHPGTIPYISAVDLLALKVNTCGLQLTNAKKGRDAMDALALVTSLLEKGPIILTQEQKDAVQVGIEDVGVWSGQDAQ